MFSSTLHRLTGGERRFSATPRPAAGNTAQRHHAERWIFALALLAGTALLLLAVVESTLRPATIAAHPTRFAGRDRHTAHRSLHPAPCSSHLRAARSNTPRAGDPARSPCASTTIPHPAAAPPATQRVSADTDGIGAGSTQLCRNGRWLRRPPQPVAPLIAETAADPVRTRPVCAPGVRAAA